MKLTQEIGSFSMWQQKELPMAMGPQTTHTLASRPMCAWPVDCILAPVNLHANRAYACDL